MKKGYLKRNEELL